jgi:hypothetical protein
MSTEPRSEIRCTQRVRVIHRRVLQEQAWQVLIMDEADEWGAHLVDLAPLDGNLALVECVFTRFELLRCHCLVGLVLNLQGTRRLFVVHKTRKHKRAGTCTIRERLRVCMGAKFAINTTASRQIRCQSTIQLGRTGRTGRHQCAATRTTSHVRQQAWQSQRRVGVFAL